MYPEWHLQVARWRVTKHFAFLPHGRVRQGFWHLSCLQASSFEHSSLVVHSVSSFSATTVICSAFIKIELMQVIRVFIYIKFN